MDEPDEENLGDMSDLGITEADKIEGGKVIGNGDNEESGGSRAEVGERAV